MMLGVARDKLERAWMTMKIALQLQPWALVLPVLLEMEALVFRKSKNLAWGFLVLLFPSKKDGFEGP